MCERVGKTGGIKADYLMLAMFCAVFPVRCGDIPFPICS